MTAEPTLEIGLKWPFLAQKRTFLPYIVLCRGGWGRICFQKYSNIPLEAIPYRIAAVYDILGKKLLKKKKAPMKYDNAV